MVLSHASSQHVPVRNSDKPLIDTVARAGRGRVLSRPLCVARSWPPRTRSDGRFEKHASWGDWVRYESTRRLMSVLRDKVARTELDTCFLS